MGTKKPTAIWRIIRSKNYALVTVNGERVNVLHGKGDMSDSIAIATKLLQTYQGLSKQIDEQTSYLSAPHLLAALRDAVAKLEKS